MFNKIAFLCLLATGAMFFTTPASASTVTVSSVQELQAALADGASKIKVEPGDYPINERIMLQDVKLEGEGEVGTPSGVRFIIDAYSNDFQGAPALIMAGNVKVKNIEFTGFTLPVFTNPQPSAFGYLGTSPLPTGIAKNKFEIKNCRFISVWQAGVSSVAIGNAGATPGATQSIDLKFTDNYLEGSTYALFVGNVRNSDRSSSIDLQVDRNTFRFADNAMLIIGTSVGQYGTIVGRSSGNIIDHPWGYGIDLIGGTDDPFVPGSAGGQDARVEWKSHGDRFINHWIGFNAWGGHRHDDIFGPDTGNRVEAEIVAPEFEHLAEYELPPGIPPDFEFIFDFEYLGWYLRDVDILGGSAYDTLAANVDALTGQGPGNKVEVKLSHAVADPGPLLVWIRNSSSDDEANGFARFVNRVPNMDPEPSFGNRAFFKQKRSLFEKSNGEVNVGHNPIPDIYFQP